MQAIISIHGAFRAFLCNAGRNTGGTEVCYAVRTKRSYDAETTLAAFNAALCSIAEFEQGCERLLAAVEDTVGPTHEPLGLR
jgi:hypothetical protein